MSELHALDRYDELVDDVEAFSQACRQPLPRVVRVNTLKTTEREVKSAFSDAGIRCDETGIDGLLVVNTDSPGTTWPYFVGWIHGQESVSALPGRVLQPKPGERIWDACAAPGSKTSQIAAMMNDTGIIIANDDNIGRLAALRSNLERLGITNVIVTGQDSRQFSFKPFGFEEFDRVLVDAPCSGEGTIRKNPSALDDWSIDFIHSISRVQELILQRAVQATQPGGIVVYSTCTFAPEENEGVLDFVLDQEGCHLVEFDLPVRSVPGVVQWEDETYDESVTLAKRIFPHHNNTGGFFCAKLEVDA